MSEIKDKKLKSVFSRGFYGRKQIYTSLEGVTRKNVVQFLEDTYNTHKFNVTQMNYLDRYYRGLQPILWRIKEVRDDINNKVVVNRAKQIVDFTTSFFVGDPLKYVARDPNSKEVLNELSMLNGYMSARKKYQVDVDVADWQSKFGVGCKVVLPADKDSVAPFHLYSLDPRQGYVVYSDDYRKEPIASVFVRIEDNCSPRFGVYTLLPTPRFYEVYEGMVVKDEPYRVGSLPLVEYPLNTARIGAFEAVLPILDAINLLESNRLDGVEQFIQSLLVFYNCTLGEDESGNPVTPQMLREAGALFLKSVGENKADVKEISAQLDQGQTQTLVNNLWLSALTIVGMPSQGDGNTGDSSNNGAVSMKNGWADSNIRTKSRDLLFIGSDMSTLDTMLRICRSYNLLSLRTIDVEIKPTRRNQDNLLIKVQSLTTMLSSKFVAPSDAFAAVDLFPDPEEAAQRGIDWYKETMSWEQAVSQVLAPQQEVEDEPSADR